MTREEAIAEIRNMKKFNYTLAPDEVFDMAISALEQQPCEDAISRILKRMWNCRGKHTTSIDKVAMEQIIRDELPPVTQKSGKWIWNDEKGYCKCSECGIGMGHTEFDYCPNCGAKMESEDKE